MKLLSFTRHAALGVGTVAVLSASSADAQQIEGPPANAATAERSATSSKAKAAALEEARRPAPGRNMATPGAAPLGWSSQSPPGAVAHAPNSDAATVKFLKDKIDLLNKQLGNAKTSAANNDKSVAIHQQQITDLNSENARLHQNVNTLTEDVARTKGEIAQVNKRLADANTALGQKDGQIRDLLRELKESRNQTPDLRRQIATLSASNERFLRNAVIAVAAVLLASIGAVLAVRQWWPKVKHVKKTVSLSVNLDQWALSMSRRSAASPRSAEFHVATQWLPTSAVMSRPSLRQVPKEAA